MSRGMADRYKNIIWILAVALLAAGYLLYRVYQPESPASVPPAEAERIGASEANRHVGSVAEVCGEVSSADYLPQVNGEPTFLNMGQAYPNQDFTAVIWGDHRGQWATPPERRYENREICVTGTIEMHEGTPQIVVEDPARIEIE